MKQHQTTYHSCSSYSHPVATRLLERTPYDPEKIRWENHALTCPICADLIATDRELAADLRQIPDPAPALIAGAVMMHIRQGRRRHLLGRSDLVWGTSATFVGLLIGALLSWSELGSSITEVGENGDELASLTLADDLDLFVADLVSASEE